MAWSLSRHKRKTNAGPAGGLWDDEDETPAPSLCNLSDIAQRVWQFCGCAYQPDLWPAADAFEGPFDCWPAIATLQRVIKSETASV